MKTVLTVADIIYVRLARLALELDELARQVSEAELSPGQTEQLQVPAAHAGLAIGSLEDALYDVDALDQRPGCAGRSFGAAYGAEDAGRDVAQPELEGVARTSGSWAEGPAFPASGEERARAFWRMSAGERVALMRGGELSIAECCTWASRAPSEVPLVNGEFEFIAAFMPEALDS